MKIHLKRSKTDKLALCQKWPADRWVLEQTAHQHAPNTICKTCNVVAEQSNVMTGRIGSAQMDPLPRIPLEEKYPRATCAHCKIQETQLYQNGVPICLDCADGRTKRKPPATDQQIRATLLHDIVELTARNEQAIEEFEAVTGKIPSGLPHPDGVQRIKNASAKLATARQELMKAHRRLDEHIGHGIVPEDMKRSG